MSGNWMDDPAVARIDKAKLNFLQALVFESGNLRRDQMLPFFMAVAKRGQEKNISFSDQEIDAIIAVLKKHASPEELGKMEKILAMRGGMGSR